MKLPFASGLLTVFAFAFNAKLVFGIDDLFRMLLPVPSLIIDGIDGLIQMHNMEFDRLLDDSYRWEQQRQRDNLQAQADRQAEAEARKNANEAQKQAKLQQKAAEKAQVQAERKAVEEAKKAVLREATKATREEWVEQERIKASEAMEQAKLEQAKPTKQVEQSTVNLSDKPKFSQKVDILAEKASKAIKNTVRSKRVEPNSFEGHMERNIHREANIENILQNSGMSEADILTTVLGTANLIEETNAIYSTMAQFPGKPKMNPGEVDRIIGKYGEYQGYSDGPRKDANTVELYKKYEDVIRNDLEDNFAEKFTQLEKAKAMQNKPISVNENNLPKGMTKEKVIVDRAAQLQRKISTLEKETQNVAKRISNLETFSGFAEEANKAKVSLETDMNALANKNELFIQKFMEGNNDYKKLVDRELWVCGEGHAAQKMAANADTARISISAYFDEKGVARAFPRCLNCGQVLAYGKFLLPSGNISLNSIN